MINIDGKLYKVEKWFLEKDNLNLQDCKVERQTDMAVLVSYKTLKQTETKWIPKSVLKELDLKGSNFERKISKLLTEKTGFKWYRVGVSSGARFTTIGAEKYQGDVTTDNKDFQNVIIECKATKGRITLEDLVNKKSKLWNWIEQSERESVGKDWILFFKSNNGKIFAVERPRLNTLRFEKSYMMGQDNITHKFFNTSNAVVSNFKKLFHIEHYIFWECE